MLLLENICLVGGRTSASKRIKDPALNHQFEGTKLISVYSSGMYEGIIEVLAHGVRVTYGRLPMSEQ